MANFAPPVHVFPVTWDTRDDENGLRVVCYGKTADGQAITLDIPFPAFFYVKGENMSHAKIAYMIADLGADRSMSCAVKRRDMWGYHPEPETFVQLGFPSAKAAKAARAKLRGRRIKTYESNVDPVLRLCHVRGLSPTGWIRVDRIPVRRYTDVSPGTLSEKPPLVFASWDIECYSSSGGFPVASNDDDCVIQIATSFQKYGDAEPYRTVVVCLGDTGEVSGTSSVDIVCEDTEVQVFKTWVDLLKEESVDVLLGYNVWQFDWRYLADRLSVLTDDDGEAPETPFAGLGRAEGGDILESNLSSAAYGDNSFFRLSTPGVLQLDVLQYIRREYKLESNSLKNVAKHFLKDQKIDLPAKDIFRLYESGDPAARAVVAEYAARDTVLPLQLVWKLDIFERLTQMGMATCVPVDYLLLRGQQVKVWSLLLRKARSMGFVIPDDVGIGTSGKYAGATVLEACVGAHFDIVSALDFASLYPSILRSKNMCYSTMLLPGDPRPEKEVYHFKDDSTDIAFVQGVPAVVPSLLEELATFRKDAKKKMAQARENDDAWGESLHNAAQLAFKVSANSVYGFLGATKGILPCVPIAAAVTGTGRRMLMRVQDLVVKLVPGTKVVYGDSVMPGTPVLVRVGGVITVRTIEDLAADWEAYPGFLKDGTDKEQSLLEGVESWTHLGWRPIRRVVRHKCLKKIWRVTTHTGIVDVTEDHSLLDENLKLVKPQEVQLGERLFSSFPEVQTSPELARDQLFVFGVFVGDGSCGEYDCRSGRKHTWAINNKDLQLLRACKDILECHNPEMSFAIYDTLQSSGVYKLCARSSTPGVLQSFVRFWRSACYDGAAKKVPDFAMGDERFLGGLWASDGCRRDNEVGGCRRIDTKNQITAQWYYLYLRSLGYVVSLNTRKDKPDIFRLTFTTSKLRKCHNGVKKIHVLHDSWDGYVYDLETAAGSFQAGVGQLIVKNTDSVMCVFNVPEDRRHDMAYHHALAADVAGQITAEFEKPVELEFEKTYYPFLLFSKKRYCGGMYTTPHAMDKIDTKGIQMVRRGTIECVRKMCVDVLHKIMIDKSAESAVTTAKDHILRFLKGEIPLEDLVLSKALRGNYKVDNQPHVAVARKIFERRGTPVPTGDRVEYVFVRDKDTVTSLQAQRAEDPAFVREHGLPVDILYYLDHQVLPPLENLLELLVPGGAKGVLDSPDVAPLVDALRHDQSVAVVDYKRRKTNAKNRQREITDFLK